MTLLLLCHTSITQNAKFQEILRTSKREISLFLILAMLKTTIHFVFCVVGDYGSKPLLPKGCCDIIRTIYLASAPVPDTELLSLLEFTG